MGRAAGPQTRAERRQGRQRKSKDGTQKDGAASERGREEVKRTKRIGA